ncbi:hypothetical protein Tco_0791267 [Tanacetum coccineum]
MQHHLLQDKVHLQDTKAKRSPNQLHLNLSLSLKKTVILNKLRGTMKCKRICALPMQSNFKKAQTNLQTTTIERSSNTRTRLKYITPRHGIWHYARMSESKAAEQADWLEDTDEEIDDQELKPIQLQGNDSGGLT